MALHDGQTIELKVTPDAYLTYRYAGASGDFNPIHIDEEFAKSVGLPGRILHGLWTMAQMARAQSEAAGGPEHLRRLSVQFLDSPGDSAGATLANQDAGEEAELGAGAEEGELVL